MRERERFTYIIISTIIISIIYYLFATRDLPRRLLEGEGNASRLMLFIFSTYMYVCMYLYCHLLFLFMISEKFEVRPRKRDTRIEEGRVLEFGF